MSNMDNGGVENVTRTQKGWRWRLRILTNSFTKIMTQLILSPTLHRSRSHPHSHKKDLPGTGDSQEHWTEYSNLPDSTTWSIVYPSFIPSWPGHFSFASGPSSDLIINCGNNNAKGPTKMEHHDPVSYNLKDTIKRKSKFKEDNENK